MGVILSGVQPTGNLHLGNYLGAIRQWVAMQHAHECLFCIVDLHAITVPQDPVALRRNTLETAAAYIASGIAPEKNIIFHQSAVAHHAELGWILNCHTPMGWLNRMTQFKEKAGKHRENAMVALFDYPVLMAADILLYKATHVPVGEDQKQHLELARDIAAAFNRHYNSECFPLPEPIILGAATRVMSLRDGTKKMSKSDESDYSRIALSDDSETIALKIRKAKTDAIEGISYDRENRPEIANLLSIYAAITGATPENAADQFASSGTGDFKKAVAEALVEHLRPVRETMQDLLGDEAYLGGLLRQGAERAAELGEKTMQEVKALVGFYS